MTRDCWSPTSQNIRLKSNAGPGAVEEDRPDGFEKILHRHWFLTWGTLGTLDLPRKKIANDREAKQG